MKKYDTLMSNKCISPYIPIYKSVSLFLVHKYICPLKINNSFISLLSENPEYSWSDKNKNEPRKSPIHNFTII